MRILVCGGRDFNNRSFIHSTLDKLCEDRGLRGPQDQYGNWLPEGVTIISGAARGADTHASDWAVTNWCELEEYPADWKTYGKKAGYLRNQQMLDEGKPNLVVAFPGGKGTKMMVDIAKKAGVEVLEIQE